MNEEHDINQTNAFFSMAETQTVNRMTRGKGCSLSSPPVLIYNNNVKHKYKGYKNMSIKKQLLAASVLTTVTLAVGLTPADGEKYPVAFSGGQRQRIGIARAIVGQPKFIVADEPISALDVSIQAQVLSLMMALREQQALTYLFISHDLSQVQAISDRVAVLYFGHLVELGSTTAIFDNPVHPYTQELLAAIPPIGKPLIAKQRQIITVGTTWTEVTPGNFVRQYPRQS